MPLAFVIAGHHTGLANLVESGPDLPKPLKERLQENDGILQELLAFVPPQASQHVLSALPRFLLREPSLSQMESNVMLRRMEFWIRFLFSSLVDADWLDTEAFLDPPRSHLRSGFCSIAILCEGIDNSLDRMMDSIPRERRDTPVNRARAEVLSLCRKAAKSSPGFFSLTVPTGGGKTLSSMCFALRHAETHGLRRVIVVIPYTSIIEQNADVYRQALGATNVIEHHSNLDPGLKGKLNAPETAQRHELACENWDAPVIVTTNVQFFESLFSSRSSSCRKLHNIARSVIILDEVQTLPPAFLLSILDSLNELVSRYGCTVVLSTATPPALTARERFDAGLKDVRPIIPDPGKLAMTLKRVEYKWPDLGAPPIGWDALARELLNHRQALAIVHKRDDARTLAQLLKELDLERLVFHLSALMCPTHRSDTLSNIRDVLQKKELCLVVSTQLVEAGVDLDFPVVYRALGGLDSMVQAAGRCNREGRMEKGRCVFFIAPTTPPPGTPKKAMGITSSLLREKGGTIDPNDPSIFETFFRELYFVETLDARAVQTNRQQFNFAVVGRDFKLIEDGFTHPVVVPYGDAENRLEALRKNPNRETLRALQPFLVSIYPSAFDKLCNAGALEEINGVFALSQTFKSSYDPDFGLITDETPKADPKALIL
ncbi:MAG: CRISPR-associated helicase Cas3' [Elusimicrobia bacterium]|nr:CRISPR-associated helicase Cas3' [Elusimicrobiota bacterium]